MARLGLIASSGWMAGVPAVAREHLRLGRWSSGSVLLSWIGMNVPYLFLPVWGGLEAAAAYRALSNLLLPVLVVGRRGRSDHPARSLRTRGDPRLFRQRAMQSVVLLGGACLAYGALLNFSSRFLGAAALR